MYPSVPLYSVHDVIHLTRSHHRTHTSREGRTPDPPASRPVANLSSFRWQPHCRSLFQTPNGCLTTRAHCGIRSTFAKTWSETIPCLFFVAARFADPIVSLRTYQFARDRQPIPGRIAIDQRERRWSFTPSSPWLAGEYHIRIEYSLEDVCGNTLTGPFDRPLRKDPHLVTEMSSSSLIFHSI